MYKNVDFSPNSGEKSKAKQRQKERKGNQFGAVQHQFQFLLFAFVENLPHLGKSRDKVAKQLGIYRNSVRMANSFVRIAIEVPLREVR